MMMMRRRRRKEGDWAIFEQVECDLWGSEDVGCCHQPLLWLRTSPLVNVTRLTSLLLRYLRRHIMSRNCCNTSEFSISTGGWQLLQFGKTVGSLSGRRLDILYGCVLLRSVK